MYITAKSLPSDCPVIVKKTVDTYPLPTKHALSCSNAKNNYFYMLKIRILFIHWFEQIFQFKNMFLWLLPACFNADLPGEFLNSYMIVSLGKQQNFWHPRGNEDVTAGWIITA